MIMGRRERAATSSPACGTGRARRRFEVDGVGESRWLADVVADSSAFQRETRGC